MSAAGVLVLLFAQVPTTGTEIDLPAKPPRNYVNLRVGASSGTKNGRPQLCGEFAPLAFLKVGGEQFTALTLEGCGTGANFLHNDPGPEVSHYRFKGRFLTSTFREWSIELMGGLGMAEAQVGDDPPGFRFTDAGDGTSTAGFEASLHARLLIQAIGGSELISELEAAAAYLPHGPKLNQPLNKILPTVTLSMGLGF